MEEKILFTQKGHVAEIALNNPQKLNCIGFEMLRSLERIIDRVVKDKSTRVLLLKGAGERAFSTGADLKEFRLLTEDQAAEWIEFGNHLFNKIEALPKPTVALISGYALGGGLELALACDFRIGYENAVLGSPELQHGWLPGWGGMARLRRVIGEAGAKEVVMLNEKTDSARALRMGLLTRVLNPGSEEQELKDFLDHLVGLEPSAFRLAKQAIMDPARTTRGPDIEFDILAMQIARDPEQKQE